MVKSLNEVIQFNNSFKTAVNLYLSLNKTEKVLSYIPTKSSINFLDSYMSSILKNKEQATLLVGPYGKGKSHLLLVLLAIVSLERNEENAAVINKLVTRFAGVDEVGEQAASDIKSLWNKKRLLPVIINDTNGDLNQAFLTALNDALKREGLSDLAPDTYYSIAAERMEDWRKNYPETLKQFIVEIKKLGLDPAKIHAGLKRNSRESLDAFIKVYPKVTAGSTFNPLAVSEVLPLYKSVSEKLAEETDFGGLYIVFDEFSKFIEGLNGNNVGNNMKLLQDICELANDSANAQIFITMVAHKSIKEYGKYLSSEIINAFTGIEGRIIEKFFVTSSKNNYELIRHAIVKADKWENSIQDVDRYIGDKVLDANYSLPLFGGQFERNDFRDIILKGCYPLKPLTAYLLLNVSEKVAQNERTLFTFISNDEPNSMARFIAEHEAESEWSIGADLVYDYFSGLFKKEITNELVHNIWLGAEAALGNCQSDDEKKIIKAMAIIQIVNKPEEVVANNTFITLAINLEDSDVFDALQERQIIYVKGSTGAYVFKTKAGSELRTEIKKQKGIKGENINYGQALELIADTNFIVPRKYNSIHAMTRYFRYEYMDADAFLNIQNADVLFDKNDRGDGKVLCLYSFSDTRQSEVNKHVKELQNQKIVVVAPRGKVKAQNLIKEYAILQEIKNNQKFIASNSILKKEIALLEDDITTVAQDNLSKIYNDDSKCQVLAWDGKKVVNYGAGNVEVAVNECCEHVYFKTPKINNELVNRSEIVTTQTKKARNNIIAELLATGGEVEADFYEGTNQEATIYRSLFKKTGLIDGVTENNLIEILDKIEDFISSCGDKKNTFAALVGELTSEPYGMRLGVVPVYLAYKLAQRHEDLIVYYSSSEIQLTADVIANISESPEDYSLFVPKADREREDYIDAINKMFSVQESRNLSENRIKNILICMQRWFRSLPQATRNVSNISKYENADVAEGMKALKKCLQRVETNPYELVFETIPENIGKGSFKQTIVDLQRCKAAFDNYLNWLIDEACTGIYKIFIGKKKSDLYHVLQEWYDRQSDVSKQGLHSSQITNFMSCIEKMDVYDDVAVTKKIAKAVTDVYLDNWGDCALEEFLIDLSALKTEIEGLKEENSSGQLKLSFTGKKGNQIEKFYEVVDEGTGSMLRNILEDTLEEFDDLSVNDRVGILLEMIEKVIG